LQEVVSLVELNQALDHNIEGPLVQLLLSDENASLNASWHAHHTAEGHVMCLATLHPLVHLSLCEDMLKVLFEVYQWLELG
jgi:hypothetical protein